MKTSFFKHILQNADDDTVEQLATHPSVPDTRREAVWQRTLAKLDPTRAVDADVETFHVTAATEHHWVRYAVSAAALLLAIGAVVGMRYLQRPDMLPPPAKDVGAAIPATEAVTTEAVSTTHVVQTSALLTERPVPEETTAVLTGGTVAPETDIVPDEPQPVETDAPVETSAAETAAPAALEGTCGTDVYWQLDPESGLLTISGSGPMDDYDDPEYGGSIAPWLADETMADTIRTVTIGEGITHVGDMAFMGTRIMQVSLADTVTSIGIAAFHSCLDLRSITIPPSVTSIGDHAIGMYGNGGIGVVPEMSVYGYPGTAASAYVAETNAIEGRTGDLRFVGIGFGASTWETHEADGGESFYYFGTGDGHGIYTHPCTNTEVGFDWTMRSEDHMSISMGTPDPEDVAIDWGNGDVITLTWEDGRTETLTFVKYDTLS